MSFDFHTIREVHTVKPWRVIRFVFAGGLATAVNLAFFFFLVRVAHAWYVVVAPASFLAAFGVSFVLQKYWTFQDANRTWGRQATLYFSILLINLLINTALVFVLVTYVHVLDIIAQALASLLIAVESFFVYQKVIFTDHDARP